VSLIVQSAGLAAPGRPAKQPWVGNAAPAGRPVASPVTVVQLTASRFFGGPERQMIELAKALPGAYRTVFVSFSEDGLCHDFLEEARRAGFEALRLQHDTPWLAAAWRELVGLLRRVPADVLCCHTPKPNLLGLLAARRLRIPVVAVSRGWTAETWRVRLYEVLDRRVLGRMDRVVCVSHAQAQRVRWAGVARQKTVVIHNAVRADRFSGPRDGHRTRLEQLFAEPPEQIVGAAGRLSPEKGFEVLLDAAAEVVRGDASVGFVLFGEGPLRDALAAKIRERGLEGRFVLAGFCSELDRLIPCFDLFALPSFTEGLPNVVLEAFAAGVPVVATAVGGTPEVVREGQTGYLVPPGDSAALAKRIADALRDESLLRRFGSRGRRRVEQCFSFASQAESYVRLFAGLLTPALPTIARGARGGLSAPATPGSGRQAPAGTRAFAAQDSIGVSPSRPAQTRPVRRSRRAATEGTVTPRHRSRPVRVCFTVDNLSGKTSQVVLGGTEQQLLTLIEQLDRRKVSPYLCLLDGENEASRSVEPDGCPVLRLGVRSLWRPGVVRAVWRLGRLLRRENIDVLQTYFPDSTHFGVAVSKLVGVPRVVRTRRGLGHSLTPWERRLGRLCSRWVDATLANSQACRRAVIAQEAAPATSVTVIENGIDVDRFGCTPPVDAARNGRPPTIGTVANLRPIKGTDVFVRAAAALLPRHRQARFMIAGWGDAEYARGLIRQHGVADRVVLRGWVEDVGGFLAELDVAVLASYSEGFPNALLEYMAAGRPIVATAVGGNVELIEHGVHGLLVPPGDPKGLAAAVDRLLGDPELAASLGSAARARVAERFGLDLMVRRHEEFYEKLVFGG